MENEDVVKRFRCPECGVDQFPDNLESDKEMKEKVETFLKGAVKQSEPQATKAVAVSLTEISEEKRRKNPFKIVGDTSSLPAVPVASQPLVSKKPAFRIVDPVSGTVRPPPPMGQIPGNPVVYYPNGQN